MLIHQGSNQINTHIHVNIPRLTAIILIRSNTHKKRNLLKKTFVKGNKYDEKMAPNPTSTNKDT
jgi:hypothetical protein